VFGGSGIGHPYPVTPDVMLAQLSCAQRIVFVAKRRFDARENLDRG